MGEVYAAEDTRLSRLVALKIVAPEAALDPDRMQRFQREARALAALNHTGIVTIYGIEESDGVQFLTMELVEGETLDASLPRGGFSLATLLAIGVQLTDAVAA